MKFFNFLFDPTKRLRAQVGEINVLEQELQKLSSERLLEDSLSLRRLIQEGEMILEEALPRAFALVREAAKRTLGQRHFDVQLMGGIGLHQGKIAEMSTGEGKTLASTAPVYLNALTGKGVHVVTVNEYLAKRDTVWMSQIYHFLGLRVACLVHEGALLYDPSYVYSQTSADETQTNAEEGKLLYKDLTYKIRGILFTVKKSIGLGHKELVYQNAIEQELKKENISFAREKVLDVIHDDKKVGIYKPDFVIEDKVILELKSLPFIGRVEENQTWTYLKGSQYKLALLVNFGGKDIDIKRIVYDTAREFKSSPRKSAYSQRESALLDKERDTTGSFLIQEEYLRPISRREAYEADITYGTNHEFGFDYLRDNLAYSQAQQVQRRLATANIADYTQTNAENSQRKSASSQRQSALNYAIVDEIDSILIDEARTPLIISAPDTESSDYYKIFSRIAAQLTEAEDYLVDEKFRSADITESGIDKVEKVLKIKNIYDPENIRLTHYLEECLKAKALFKRDKDYVVKDNEIIIVDQNTGRLMLGRRYSGGLHQAIEAKEGVRVQQESRTYAQITIQNYFRLYKKLAGMTGTAQTSAEEFDKVYGLQVVTIPTNKPVVRKDLLDVIYKTQAAKYAAVAEELKQRQQKGQPVLVGTISIEKNELLSQYLNRVGVRHEILNAKNNEREGAIIAQAGKLGAVTIATNMAGRGVDIILGGNPPDILESERVKALGGLHVVGTERHDARRIDNQLRGRSGRQGDSGSSQFFLSLEDDLMRIFGGNRIKSLMESLDVPEDMPIESSLISKAVSQAQAKVEGFNFDGRKHLLDYDDILNKQRLAIYEKRKKLLEENAHPQILAMLDLFWMNHLESMEALRESVRLRAYGQHDPLVEYRRESHELFRQLLAEFDKWLEENKERLQQVQKQPARINLQVQHPGDQQQISNSQLLISNENQNAKFRNWKLGIGNSHRKVGRNDPCPCGSEKKYKKCHGQWG